MSDSIKESFKQQYFEKYGHKFPWSAKFPDWCADLRGIAQLVTFSRVEENEYTDSEYTYIENQYKKLDNMVISSTDKIILNDWDNIPA